MVRYGGVGAEIKLAEQPSNVDIQVDLLTCLKQSGQHGKSFMIAVIWRLLVSCRSADRFAQLRGGYASRRDNGEQDRAFAVEAAWATSRWDTLATYAGRFHGDVLEDFNVSLAELLGALRRGEAGKQTFAATLQGMRDKIASAMTFVRRASLRRATTWY